MFVAFSLFSHLANIDLGVCVRDVYMCFDDLK